ncbi:MAG TPA: S8 family serine peptidase [Anaerolineaceae bacterium]|nr:S8 family serine peptidase [Anaerolineaceae bacterium]
MTKRFIFTLLVIAFMACTAASPVHAQGIGPIEPLTPVPALDDSGEMVNETAHRWFVEFYGAPTIEGASIDAIKAEQSAFRSQAVKAGIVYSENYVYTDLFNGLSVTVVDVADAIRISRLPGVKNIYPVETIAMPETTESTLKPELFSSLNMIGAAAVQSELGFTGKGIKVAVMDTGIDVNHPAFGGDGVAETDSTYFYSSPRVLYGWDFVGNDFNADDTSPTYNPVAVPDDNPDDCAGHGSHVAGIIGANDDTNGLKGVAPDVTFGAYRVFGCEGSTFSDIMLSAMERAQEEGMQVLNMSIGSSFEWPQYPTAVAASRLVDHGMVVVASIGNSGDYGLYAAGSPGLGNKVIGVASFDNTEVFLPYLTVNGREIGYITMTYSPEPPTSGNFEVVNIGQACAAIGSDLTGKVALAARGTCSFGIKATNAIDAGAEAVLISNSASGVFSGTLGAPIGDGSVPVVGISKADGDFIRTQTAPVMMDWTDQMASFPSPTGGLISSFSSYGLSPDLAVKPDLGAPGGNIYSSYPLELGGYVTMSGTSMASPHVAGAAALLLQAKPSTPASAVKGILQSNAEPQLWWGNPGLGFLDNVHRQGAGLIQIDKTILSQLIYKTSVSPSVIAMGESGSLDTPTPKKVVLTVKNSSPYPITYNISSVNALSTEGVIGVLGFADSDAVVTFKNSSVTVPARGYATVKVTITPPTYPENGLYGGYIVFAPTNGSFDLRVPFAGYAGDYQEIKVLEPTANEFPWLTYMDVDGYWKVEDPTEHTFTMVNGDFPRFLVHLEHQAQKMTIKIYRSSDDAGMGKGYKEVYLPRNSTAGGVYEFPFDGVVVKNGVSMKLKDGTYYAVIKILKANGDPLNPAHWETWESPDFVVDRP